MGSQRNVFAFPFDKLIIGIKIVLVNFDTLQFMFVKDQGFGIYKIPLYFKRIALIIFEKSKWLGLILVKTF